MTDVTLAVFETVALRLLIDLIWKVDGISMDFLYVQVKKQTFTEGTQSRRLQDTYIGGDIAIALEVAADIMPGDPEHFDFQRVIETFFSVHFDEFLARLQAGSDYFQPIYENGVVNGKEEPTLSENNAGNKFFTMPLLVGLAATTLALFVLGTLVTRRGRSEDEVYENRLGSLPKYISEEDPSFFSSVHEEENRANHAKIFRFPQCGAENYSTPPTARSRHCPKVSRIYNKCTVRRTLLVEALTNFQCIGSAKTPILGTVRAKANR
jgi:hypothetical protein